MHMKVVYGYTLSHSVNGITASQHAHFGVHLLHFFIVMLTLPSHAYRGRENFARGEFRGENFAVKNGGEIFPWRIFWRNSSILCHRGRGIVFPKKSQALTNAPEPTVSCADVWNLVLLIR